MVRFRTHACTDVTGFGMLGHLLEMAQGSDTAVRLNAQAFVFLEDALSFAELGILPAGMYRNRRFAERAVEVGDVPLALQDLLFDPQTSGGLLIAVDPADADAMLEELLPAAPSARWVGTVEEYRGEKRIFLRNGDSNE